MELYEKIIELKRSNKAFVIVTVVNTAGSVPGKTGFKMIVESNGKTSGTVGGGAIEKTAIKEALNRLKISSGGLEEYILSDKGKSKDKNIVPMSCNGKVWIYYEVSGSVPTVYIFGGGHVGSALIYFLKTLNYHIVLIDNREEFINKNKDNVNETVFEEYDKFCAKFKPVDDSYYVILTHGHKHDYEILSRLYKRNIKCKYIGVIASKDKAKGMIAKLKDDIGTKVNLDILHTPIGLKIGGNTAEEIALCIAAEMQSVRFNKETKS